MSKCEAILFDLDGTLLHSAPDIRQAVNQMLADEGRPPLSLEQVTSFIGDGMMPLCRKALEATGGLPSDDIFPYVQKFITYYRNVKPDPQQVLPYVRETLASLQAQGIKLGVCTNKNESATIDLLKQLDLLRYFGFVAGGDTFTVHKPNPGHIFGVIEALQASLDTTVYVGDGLNDVIACQRAGLPCIVVTHGYAQDYESMEATILIDGFDKLPEALAQIGYPLASK